MVVGRVHWTRAVQEEVGVAVMFVGGAGGSAHKDNYHINTVIAGYFRGRKNFGIFAVTRKLFAKKGGHYIIASAIVACGCIRNQPLQ